jgi:xanthine/uracil permease
MQHQADRSSEWFVPKWGPLKFRILIGLLFLPYTGMVLSFVVIGSMLAETIHWDRVLAGVVVYFLGLGIAAHALDALGSKKTKPWGEHFSKGQLWGMAIISLIIAYGIAIYYMILYVPLLWIIAILEGFFVFAYNLEWFNGRYHTDKWFAFSWGMLPVLAGHVLQTNRVSWGSLMVAVAMGLLSYVEISASRPYKELKREGLDGGEQYEKILKGISLGVICLGAGLLVWRLS